MKFLSLFCAFFIAGCCCDVSEAVEQKNKYFVIERKSADNLTPATVLSLRAGMKVAAIPDYLGTLCDDYDWMSSKRFLYIFETSEYSEMFDSFGIENIKMKKPIEKFVAKFNPDEQSLTFYPLLSDKRRKVYLEKGWCK
jgi:hypothetical protein